MESLMLIGMVAGEASGDILGAGLIRALRKHYPEARFAGVGGPRMLAEGFESITPMERLSVMGFVEPLGRLPELLKLKKDLVSLFQRESAAVFVGIDSPGFNLRLEQNLHDVGILTTHYVSPSVWAWGQKRIFKIAKAVDLMLTLFPFEQEIYDKHNIRSVCVGHPLADEHDPDVDVLTQRLAAQSALSLAAPGNAAEQTPLLRYICLMPGSRGDEVKRLMPVFLAAAQRCLQDDASLRFVIPAANEARKLQIEALLAGLDLRHCFTVLDGQSHAAMQASELIVMASGTATLEALLLQRPMIVAYKMSWGTWQLARRLVKVPYISLPNLLAGEELVPELLQDEASEARIAQEMSKALASPARQQELQARFRDIHKTLRRDADTSAAQAIAELL
ncbi:lipid-A-disaccharide synthase [Pseudohongiella nitratireducens]|uniref:lipid-A-disaccharide synthase n=1 Tax=Pseudohongiella nitratireducens TaxID=1768907 RepID=UPI0030EF8569|tara:strand:+ start:14699 stop:15877 length:1179 start_codon:yes stop_codon:yes gene_type:complete